MNLGFIQLQNYDVSAEITIGDEVCEYIVHVMAAGRALAGEKVILASQVKARIIAIHDRATCICSLEEWREICES